jgi:hypothetical protein
MVISNLLIEVYLFILQIYATIETGQNCNTAKNAFKNEFFSTGA